ncbi:ABC transporter ATP-binding protein [Limibaculum sp. FT325]|nr:ABC transporter ATP-binding protein [Limibaculum sediminis]MCL5776116.1 ABC transporter ATP-binding protein [Limibaculum sediminis]
MQTQATSDFDIEFRGVTKRFGAVTAVQSMDLQVARGGFFSFLGPSGCGKTTSLRMIAGFEQPSEGDVLIEGRSVVGTPAHRRPVNMVFQHYALFPHLDVFDNVAYGLRQRRPRPDRDTIRRQVGEALELVRLSGFEGRRSWELSGGQQQRVALARALVNRPTVLLLDEPLAALDRKLRRDMQIELQTLQRDVGITFVLVTHDQEEALSMSDTICIMRDGRIVQMGGARELYDEPANAYVADFVGKSNFIAGTARAGGGLRDPHGRGFGGRRPAGGRALGEGEKAVLAVRPETVAILPDGAASGGFDVALAGRIRNRIFLGEHTEYLVAVEGIGDMLALVPKLAEEERGSFGEGQAVTIAWNDRSALVLGDD